MLDKLIAKLRTLDPKLVAAGVAYAATFVVVDLLNLGLEDVAVDLGAVSFTWKTLIAYAAAGAAGYWKSNSGTILRTPQEDGNPQLKLVSENLEQP